ncbi:MAG: S8 family serine peptidase [Candidatus Eisenbacteria bacterium]|uniref:S8 family serine peptidase n=1 Tax=Eiseniibacteriota bacterium TaxID=2212470 RepID=A0A933W1W5_UNCEI|nr:S8 family serine peptidase [Candidatus Eisenbacteria bacterium]
MRRLRMPAVVRAVLTSLAALAFALTLAVAPAAARPFAPVQGGFQPNAPDVPEHVPGRVLVKLTSAARASSFRAQATRFGGAVAGARFGIDAIDGVLDNAGATAVAPSYLEPANAVEAARLGVARWYTVSFDESQDAVDIANQLSTADGVEAVSLDWIAFPAVVPADPLHAMHWGHNNTAQMLSYNWTNNNHETGSPVGTVGFDTNAQAAWDAAQGYGSASVIIAIIDSGVQTGHPDLTQVAGYDFGDNDANPDDNSSQAGHGTACAGVAAANANSLGSAGAAPNCSIMPLKVANSAGTMSFTSIQNALYWAADHGANIISMSLGAAIASDAATDAAITYAYNAGCVILAATGNENKSTISYPAINPNVIGVGAASPCGDRKRSSSLSTEVNPGVSTDPRGYTCDGERWWGSNYGVATADAGGAVDVIAPTILPTTDRLGSLGYDASDYSKWFNGTSCATPYAAGVCALIKSANPTWTNAQIRARLTSTAQDVVNAESGAGWDRYAGYGMVDAAAAVAGAVPPTDQVTVTYPNGGESLTTNSTVNITWTSVGSFTTVNLDYSSDGGTTWTSIAANTPNDGTQAWTVPAATTTTGRVRVSGGTATDMSNANFTIAAPPADQVTVTYPNGGESLVAGSSVNITWTSVGSFTTVNLDYSSDGGTTWTSIVAGTPNDGTQAWTVPAGTTTTGRVRVSGGTATDMSNANFSIVLSTGYASLPYSTSFDSGVLDAYWSTFVTASGRVQLLTTNTPHSGARHMVMDCSVANNYSVAAADLKLNLSGVTQANLSFWWKDFGDETQTQDGIYFSNNGGTTFTKVYSLAPASFSNNTWRNVVLDVDALAATAGLALNGTFVVRFEQYDNQPVSGADGMAFDDISVTIPASLPAGISAETEPNDASTTANGPVGTGRAVSGAVGSSTDNDWYYLDVTTAGTLNLSLAITGTADLDWYLYNSALTQVAQGYSTANPEVGTYSATAGRYYVKVNGYLGATASYALTVTGGLANANIPPQKGLAPLGVIANAMHQNSPNPFSTGTSIRFSLAQRGHVNVQVIDASGRHVATLQDGEMPAGQHQLEWAGRTSQGTRVAAGVYFYRLTTPGFTQTRKMVVTN